MARKKQSETIKAETLIQRIARNLAWYALRIARPEYVKSHSSVIFTFVNITDADKAHEYVRCMELRQSSEKRYGDNPPVLLHHVIFRG